MLILSRLGTIRPAATFALWQYIDITCKLRPRNTDLLAGYWSRMFSELWSWSVTTAAAVVAFNQTLWTLHFVVILLSTPAELFSHLDEGMFGDFINFICIVSAATAPQEHDWSGVLPPFTLSVITIGHYCMYEIEQRPIVKYKQRISI